MYPLLNVPLLGTYPQFRLYSDNSQLFTFPRMTLICRNLPEFLVKQSPFPQVLSQTRRPCNDENNGDLDHGNDSSDDDDVSFDNDDDDDDHDDDDDDS